MATRTLIYLSEVQPAGSDESSIIDLLIPDDGATGGQDSQNRLRL